MNRTQLKLTLFAFIILFNFSCKKKTTVSPVPGQVAKVWYASKVNEGSAVAYDKTATSNSVPGYTNFKLDFSSTPNVTITNFDGRNSNTFTGTYTITNNNTITLSSLTPTPTGTGGTMAFAITSISDTQLVLTANQVSAKTGNTTNVYTLSLTK